MKRFIDENRGVYGVEPICKVLPIAPLTYCAQAAREANSDEQSARAKRDAQLCAQIRMLWEANYHVYGARKVWRQLQRDAVDVARCTVERLIHEMGICGVVSGKPAKATVRDPAFPCPADNVNRQFHASRPNVLWVADFTYVPTQQGFVYVAFVIDVFARRIVGWKVSRSLRTDFVLDALERAPHRRKLVDGEPLIHHSDRGVQYVSLRYSERLKDAGVQPSVGSVGDSYDNALAETINGLYKAEVIHRKTTWRDAQAVELATLDWVDWFNRRRLLGPIGYIPPAEAEARYYAATRESAAVA